ncbi:MAG: terminase family protein [Myxococcota bacterium]|nr:terminase family protein [Myxococcota bacterium]
MTTSIVKKNEGDFAEWLHTEWGFLMGLGRYNFKALRLEPYQISFLQNRSRFRCATKSRQVGFSFVFALEALARCHLRPNHSAVIVSYNQDDSKEKILIARQIHEELPLAYQKRIKHDSKTELTFESNGPKKFESRILSAPSKAPRGKSADVYLDEFAHYANDREVYKGSTALILHNKGQLTGASTPLGRRGMFWEIACQERRKYTGYTRQVVPWWLSSFFCTDVKAAAALAAELDTEERVMRFGTSDIVDQFEALSLEDFQQEFEAEFVDASYSYYPYDLILPCTDSEHGMCEDFADIPLPSGRIVAGFDVGRTRDRSELAVFEEKDDGRLIARLFRSYKNVTFAEQEAQLIDLMETVPVARLSIDKTGIGMHMTENLSAAYPQVQGETFTNEAKERWATHFKILLQKRKVLLPADRELVSQTHSIKRRVLPSGRVAFEAARGKNGHADRFWAVALACQKERDPSNGRTAVVSVRIIG